MGEPNHVLTAIKVWAAAAWADGVIVEAERLAMTAIIEVATLTESERDVARRWIDHRVGLEDLELAKIPAAERLHIYSVACGMAAFDKDVAAAERGFVDRLGTALGISAADAAKARAGAGLA